MTTVRPLYSAVAAKPSNFRTFQYRSAQKKSWKSAQYSLVFTFLSVNGELSSCYQLSDFAPGAPDVISVSSSGSVQSLFDSQDALRRYLE